MGEIYSNIFTIFLLICATFITFLVIKKEFISVENVENISYIENWKEIKFSDNKSDQNRDKVQVVKFLDYQCPYCKLSHEVLQNISESYQDKIRILYVHFPLDNHPLAFISAIAAECARLQDSFDSFQDQLFSNQAILEASMLKDIAVSAGLNNIQKFESCLLNEQTHDIVKDNINISREINIQLLPSFLINGTLIAGLLTEDQLREYIDLKLNE